MSLSTRLSICIALLCLATLVGCGGPYVMSTGVLPNYARLHDNTDMSDVPGHARSYSASDFLLSDYDVLYVSKVQHGGRVKTPPEDFEHYGEFLVDRMLNGLRKLNKFDILTTDAQFLDSKRYGDLRVVTLEMFITHLSEGSGMLRYFVGFDAGRVDVQIEGRVVDAQTGRVLMEFADRRRFAGVTSSGFNWSVLSAKPVVEEILVRQAYAIRKLFETHP